jgi:hypothetical protein
MQDPLSRIEQALATKAWLNVTRSDSENLKQIRVLQANQRGFDVFVEDAGDEWTVGLGPLHIHFRKPFEADAAFQTAMDAIFGYSYVYINPGVFFWGMLLRTRSDKDWATTHRMGTFGRGLGYIKKPLALKNRHRFE